MASIARSRDALKSEPLDQSELVRGYLSKEDLTEAAAAANYHWRERVWTPMLTLWTFLLQVLHPGWVCREVVAHVLAQQEAAGTPLKASPDPSAYSQGRKRLPLSLFAYGLRKVGETLQTKVGDGYRWCGRRVWVVDGFSCSMPDTPDLQKAFGQPTGQKKGCGFPVAKLVAMFCWASGAVLDVAIGAYRSNELALWRELWDQLKVGDVVLGDRFYGAYANLAQLQARGCDGVFRLRGSRARTISFRQGQRLGQNDRLFTWSRPTQCPRTLTPEELAQLPATLTVRVLRFDTRIKGFRSRRILVVTTLLDPKAFPLEKIAALYRDRWTVELRIREVKTTLKMEILRGQSENVVREGNLYAFPRLQPDAGPDVAGRSAAGAATAPAQFCRDTATLSGRGSLLVSLRRHAPSRRALPTAAIVDCPGPRAGASQPRGTACSQAAAETV